MSTKKQTPAQAIKSELNKAFKGVKFSCRYQTYSGGSSVHVDWTNGPTTEQVEAITSKYQYNGSVGIDDYVPMDNIRYDIPQAGYVFTRREVSPEIKSTIELQICDCHGWELATIGKWGNEADTIRLEMWDYLESQYIDSDFTPDYIAWTRAEDERKEREYQERKELERIEDEKRAKAAEQFKKDELARLESEKWTDQEKECYHACKIVNKTPIELETPLIVSASFPYFNKQDRLSGYISEYLAGENSKERARIVAEIELTEKEFEVFSSNLLNDHVLPNLKNYGGSALPESDPRYDEFSTVENFWGDKEMCEYFRNNHETICIAVKSPVGTVLVNSEGYSYARYVGFIEN